MELETRFYFLSTFCYILKRGASLLFQKRHYSQELTSIISRHLLTDSSLLFFIFLVFKFLLKRNDAGISHLSGSFRINGDQPITAITILDNLTILKNHSSLAIITLVQNVFFCQETYIRVLYIQRLAIRWISIKWVFKIYFIFFCQYF